MKLVEMKCKNCGADLKANPELKDITCNYCGTKFKLDDGVVHHKFDDAEETGYAFEKGKIRAREEAKQKKEEEARALYQTQLEAEKKRKNLKWWILGWIFFFPIPVTILIWKSKWEKKKKIIVTVIFWVVLLICSYASDETPESNVSELNYNFKINQCLK